MVIAVNTRLMQFGKLDGIGWFTWQTLKRLSKNYPEHSFHFLFDRNPEFNESLNSNIRVHVIRPKARHPLAYLFWMELRVFAWLKHQQPDLFFSPDGMLCLRYKGKQMGVIHDLNFEHRPQDLRWFDIRYYQTFYPRFAKKAWKLLTVSEFSKLDIHQTYSIESNKIEVVYNGINEGYKPLPADAKQNIRIRHTAGKPYWIFLGSLHPRKNILGLLKAYHRYRNLGGTHLLVLCGSKYWGNYDADAYILQNRLQDAVIFKNQQPLTEINLLVAAAEALCLISFFEGFGIPVIEAMQCGTPVICSNTTALNEIAADAAIKVAPDNIQAIAEALMTIEQNFTLKTQLIEKGLRRAKDFSWDQTADRVAKAMEL